MRTAKAQTKTEAVRLALREFVRLKRKEKLLGMRDRFEIEDTWAVLRESEIEELSQSTLARSS